MMRLTPTMRLPMLLSNRNVWASSQSSIVTTRQTPSVLPRGNPNTYLAPNQRASTGLPTTYRGSLCVRPCEAVNLTREFAGTRTGTVVSPYLYVPETAGTAAAASALQGLNGLDGRIASRAAAFLAKL